MPESFRDLAELNNVHTTLASFNLRNEALRAPQAGGQLDLCDAGGLTGIDKELNEFLVPLREDR